MMFIHSNPASVTRILYAHCTSYNVHKIFVYVYTVHWTVYTVQCTLYTQLYVLKCRTQALINVFITLGSTTSVYRMRLMVRRRRFDFAVKKMAVKLFQRQVSILNSCQIISSNSLDSTFCLWSNNHSNVLIITQQQMALSNVRKMCIPTFQMKP